jgi:glycosyltransferase involved in cell wall biosynthesis
VIKSNQTPGADVALRVARRFRRKFVARCGYLYSDFMERRHGEDSPEARSARALEREVFTSADRTVVTTSAMRETVISRYLLSPEKVKVIPNYVETDLFRPQMESRSVLPQIGFVGRLEEQKNLVALLAALDGLDAELVLVGTGPLADRLREEATGRNLSIRFLGSVPHRRLPDLLNRMDLFAFPSLYEGHPKALLEAMACGLPVIGGNSPGIRELIRHGDTGWLCGTDPESIRAAVQELLDRPQLRALLGRNAREYVLKNFSLERVLDLEISMLQEVAGA